jgi:uncharacterized protein involved in exopolysaccharide biosynthesis
MKINEVTLGNYRKKASMQQAQAGMGAAFAPSAEQRAAAKAKFDKRSRGLERVAARDDRGRALAREKEISNLIASLPKLKAEYDNMKKEYESLGGSNWQYADRDQNLTDAERRARSLESPMQHLLQRIRSAEQAQQGLAEGKKK